MGLGPWPPWTEGGSKNASWWSDAWTPKRASRVLIVNKSCQPGQKRDVNPVKTQGGNPVNSVNPVNPVCRRVWPTTETKEGNARGSPLLLRLLRPGGSHHRGGTSIGDPASRVPVALSSSGRRFQSRRTPRAHPVRSEVCAVDGRKPLAREMELAHDGSLSRCSRCGVLARPRDSSGAHRRGRAGHKREWWRGWMRIHPQWSSS